MISYLTVTFSTEGSRPSEVVDRLHSIGFKPTKGNYDFIYNWDKSAKVQDAIWLADKVHETLRGMRVLYKMESE